MQEDVEKSVDPKFVDRIYECAFAPELWPDVLEDLAAISDSRGGILMAANLAQKNALHWTTSTRLRDLTQRFFARGLFPRKRVNDFLNLRYGGFITEAQVYGSRDEMAADPVYSDWLWPAGLGWCAATAITLPTGDILVLTVERDHERGPPDAAILERLNALRPHLARGALVSARLQLERARVASETLALIGLPALVFDFRGKVIAANSLMEASTDQISWRAGGRVSLRDPKAEALLDEAFKTLAAAGAPQVFSFALRAADTAAMVAHVIPIRGVVRDIFVRCAGVLVLTPVTLPNAPPVELVQSLFDLTPAEARVARSLVAGETVEDIAASGRVTRNTVRTQMRGVLEKTGCRRQAEVVALLSGIATPRG